MKTCIRWAVLLGVVAMLSLALPATAQDDTYFPGAEWRTSTPEEQGMDSAKLLEALQYIEDEALPIDSLTVIRNGYVVLDAYYYPYTADMKHHFASATRGFTATLLGIAMDQGLITSLDQPIRELLPNAALPLELNPAVGVTVGELLAWSSGFYCDWLNIEPDALASDYPAVARFELIAAQGRRNLENGQVFDNGCTFDSDLLMGVLSDVTVDAVPQFAENQLFASIGIQDYTWMADKRDVPFGAAGLWLTPYDMAKLGYLYLHRGQWEDNDVVSESWIDFVTCVDPESCLFEQPMGAANVSYPIHVGFGHHWFLVDFGTYVSWDLTGQMLLVNPDRDIVGVITSPGIDWDPAQQKIAYGVFLDRILGSVASDEALPVDDEAYGALSAEVAILANPVPGAPAPLPEIASAISGHMYDFKRPLHAHFWLAERDLYSGQPLDIASFSITFDEEDTAVLTLTYADGSEMSIPIGLDGVWRTVETEFGMKAARGAWYEGPVSFRFELRTVGNDDRQLFNMRFDGERAFVGWVHAATLTTQQVQASMRE
ncbi:MAG: serine hydrolase [Chloroflexi bacterium]|nr:serine hydrolase [Chloroflexota bacterium]